MLKNMTKAFVGWVLDEALGSPFQISIPDGENECLFACNLVWISVSVYHDLECDSIQG